MEFIERLRTTAGVVTDDYMYRNSDYTTKVRVAEVLGLNHTSFEQFAVTGVTGKKYMDAVRSFVSSDERLLAIDCSTDFGTVVHFILQAPTPEEQAFIDQAPVKTSDVYYKEWLTGDFPKKYPRTKLHL